MPNTPSNSVSQEQIDTVDEIRRKLADGFVAVKSSEITLGIAAFSIEELISKAIDDLTVDQSDIRPCRLTIIERVKTDVFAAVDRALQLPEESFTITESDSANTSEG
jgi:hypothetical protein